MQINSKIFIYTWYSPKRYSRKNMYNFEILIYKIPNNQDSYILYRKIGPAEAYNKVNYWIYKNVRHRNDGPFYMTNRNDGSFYTTKSFAFHGNFMSEEKYWNQ